MLNTKPLTTETQRSQSYVFQLCDFCVSVVQTRVRSFIAVLRSIDDIAIKLIHRSFQIPASEENERINSALDSAVHQRRFLCREIVEDVIAETTVAVRLPANAKS